MIFRTFDPTIHNRIANIPSVRTTIGRHIDADQPVDFSDCASRPADYILLTDGQDAASIFEQRGPVVLDGHSLFSPACRGRAAVSAGRDMIDWLFRHTKAEIITGATPTDLKAALWFNRQLGFVSDGVRMIDNAYWRKPHEWFHILRSDWLPPAK